MKLNTVAVVFWIGSGLIMFGLSHSIYFGLGASGAAMLISVLISVTEK